MKKIFKNKKNLGNCWVKIKTYETAGRYIQTASTGHLQSTPNMDAASVIPNAFALEISSQ